ncbi:YfiT family bacillithiol transferase [Robertkochia flava]|uniref:YfiT family bacillithiol transferase n=1 Tax=Robertkochia flava TaxID=3447986 RepID=UPI001CCCB242|nr:putative metal-dependent hydrolase [Robertkochia marina]
MEKQELELLRYPIGRFVLPGKPSLEDVEKSISIIKAFPELLKGEVEGLDDAQLDTPYRPEGWTLRQVVHHVADSHMNAYIRFKWTLTEDTPEIKTYREGEWAKLPDVNGTPIEMSMSLLEALHRKWVYLLKALNPGQWQLVLYHPGFGKEIILSQLVCQYSWHCMHHLGHIRSLKESNNWP